MRFLHTSDLHIGKKLNGISLLDDQKDVLNQIVNIAINKKCSVVLLSGDIYDNSTPASEAMDVFNDFLVKLSEQDIQVFIIPGNHDSSSRIAYLSPFLKKSGIYISEPFTGKMQKETLRDEYEEINIYLLPFIKPIETRAIYEDQNIKTYEDSVRKIIKETEIDISKRNIILTHYFITSSKICDSEELQIGGLDDISHEAFNDFDYVALGHIHSPQYISRETLRYSGSPLKFSFSEIHNKNNVLIVDYKEKGNITIEKEMLTSLHNMRDIKGEFKDVINMEKSYDYIRVTLTDEDVVPGAISLISSTFPNLVKLQIQNSKTSESLEISPLESLEEKTPLELFCDFYKLQNNNVEASKEKIDYITNLLEKIGENK